MKSNYDLYKEDKFIGTYTARMISDICGVDKRRVSVYADMGNTFGDGYRCDFVETMQSTNDQMAEEWDEIRIKLLKSRKHKRERKYFVKVLDSITCRGKKFIILCKVNLQTNRITYSIADKREEYLSTENYKDAVKFLLRMNQNQAVSN